LINTLSFKGTIEGDEFRLDLNLAIENCTSNGITVQFMELPSDLFKIQHGSTMDWHTGQMLPKYARPSKQGSPTYSAKRESTSFISLEYLLDDM
jgi:hypothetical protein